MDTMVRLCVVYVTFKGGKINPVLREMTVVDDVHAKYEEIIAKLRWIKSMSTSRTAGDPLWVAGDAGFVQYKVIVDVQSNLLTTLADELEALVT